MSHYMVLVSLAKPNRTTADRIVANLKTVSNEPVTPAWIDSAYIGVPLVTQSNAREIWAAAVKGLNETSDFRDMLIIELGRGLDCTEGRARHALAHDASWPSPPGMNGTQGGGGGATNISRQAMRSRIPNHNSHLATDSRPCHAANGPSSHSSKSTRRALISSRPPIPPRRAGGTDFFSEIEVRADGFAWNAGNALDVENALSRHAIPLRDGAARQPKLQRQRHYTASANSNFLDAHRFHE